MIPPQKIQPVAKAKPLITGKDVQPILNLPTAYPKHNRWIEGLESGMSFFYWIMKLGYYIWVLISVISILTFWYMVGTSMPAWSGIVALVMLTARLGLVFLLGGAVLLVCLKFLHSKLEEKERRILVKEGMNYVRN